MADEITWMKIKISIIFWKERKDNPRIVPFPFKLLFADKVLFLINAIYGKYLEYKRRIFNREKGEAKKKKM